MFHRDLKGPALHAPTNERVENNTGAIIQKLQVVSLDGHGTLYPQVILANPSIQSNFGIAMQEIVNGGNGYVTTVGFMVQVDTSSWPVNTLLYSDASANLTSVPNGNPVAIVVKQDNTCGSLYVLTLGDQLQYSRFYKEKITLNSDQISSGTIILNKIPDNESNVRLVPRYGIEQEYGDDFIVSGNELIFKGLGLDGFLEIGETVYIYYRS